MVVTLSQNYFLFFIEIVSLLRDAVDIILSTLPITS